MNLLGKIVPAALLALSAVSLRAADDPLAWPPITAQAKPWAFNWWMGSAVDKTNLTRELERYAAAGLGGIHIIPIYGAKGFEDKYIKYLSPEWMEMMGYAVSEAKRLGMGVDMTTGSGWCFGGPQVSDDEANAFVVCKTYELKPGEKLTQKFNKASTQALVAYGPDGKVIELTDKISADGDVDWSAPASSLAPAGGEGRGEGAAWTIYAISQKPAPQKVKRAGPGGEGWMLNLIYPRAMDDFLKPYTAAFAAYHGPKPRAQYHDSYEYKSDWSPDFFAQFEKRRGYKLQNELPALFPDSRITNHASTFAEHRARVLCDYRQTVSEIMAEESLPKWVNWSHERGFLTRNQAHGSPGNWLDLYAAVDIPETEMFRTDRSILISKFASAAAHVTGKRLVSAETGTWIVEHFTETLADMKYLQDEMFLAGVNHIFYHGTCYSPDEAPWPGWVFYASYEMNPRNAAWRDAAALNAYAARVQSVLQSGQPDNDILLYWNIADFWMQPGDKLLPQLTVHARDWFEGQPIGKVAKELCDNGYAFDYVSDAQLKTANVVGKEIQMPGGKYKVIVVPECKYIPLETFKQLLALATNGATIIFKDQRPKDVSGFNCWEQQKSELLELRQLRQIPRDPVNLNVVQTQVKYGAGLISPGGGYFFERDAERAGIIPEPMVEAGLSFVRRSFDGGWNYFIANRTETNFDGWITLARPAKSIVILDPMTGNSGVAATRQSAANSTEVHLQLAAGQSVILRALNQGIPNLRPIINWTYWQPQTPAAKPQPLTGAWNVKFIAGGPMLPAEFQIAQLASWTTFPDTNCQAFGGTAKYETTFDAPTPHSALRTPHFLGLGNVQQSARVRVNGKDYGTLITPPFRVVVDNLQPSGNVLEVEVTSASANRIRDLDRRGVKWQNFYDINFVNQSYKKFDASNWPLTDCGLLGPVTLTPVKAE